MKSIKFPLLLIMLLPILSIVVLFAGIETRKEFIKDLKKYEDITSFNLVNQYAQPVDTTIFKNHVTAVQFCTLSDLKSSDENIDKQLFANFKYLQNEFKTENTVQLLTIITDVSRDSSSLLLGYAKEQGVTLSNWSLLCGDSTYIKNLYESVFNLSSNSIFAELDRKNTVYLVDKEFVIKNAYNGLSDVSIRKLAEHIALTTPESKKKDIRYVPEKIK